MHLRHAAWISLGVACAVSLGSPAIAQSYTRGFTYPNPDGDMSKFRDKPCRDPWVTIAVQIVYGTANAARCVTQQYNKGQWSSFNQLVHAVADYKRKMSEEKLTFSPRWIVGTNRVVPALMDSNTGAIVAAGAGNIVAAGGGNIVAAGGGNIIGNNGANLRPSRLIGPDGATLIGNDAGSIKSMKYDDYRNSAKVDLTTGKVLQSSRTVRLPGGNTLYVR